MSMPSFPPNGADMTREEALTMIIASIAMEELSLSHILNAESEKIQYILGRPCASPQDVLAVNKSVTALVEAVNQNQMLLKNKLAHVLEFCPPPPPICPVPCPPPCQPGPCPPCPFSHKTPPCEKSAIQLTGQREEMLWNTGCRLSWRQRSCLGKGIHWDERDPTQIYLNPRGTYAVQYTLNVSAASQAKGTGEILLKQSPHGTFTETPPLHFSMEHLAHCPQTMRYAAFLYPRTNKGCEASLSLVLDAKFPLCVEQSVIDVVEFGRQNGQL